MTFDPAVNQETGASGRRYQGITLIVDGLNWVQIWRPQEAGGRKQCYNPAQQEVQLVWSQLLQFEAVRTSFQERAGPSGPRLSSPAERERSAAKDRGTGGQYVAVSVQSPTHLSHITLSQPFRIKCERYIFLKKRVRSSLLLILLLHAYVYVTEIDYLTK